MKRLHKLLIGLFLSLLLVGAGIAFAENMHNSKPTKVSIDVLVQERLNFQAVNPPRTDNLTKENFTIRLAEIIESGRAYSTQSKWNRRDVVIEGFWGGHFDGISIASGKKNDSSRNALLMRASSKLPRWRLPIFSRIIPSSWICEPIFLDPGERIRIHAIYHATGYSPGTLLESSPWLEFYRIERWNEGENRWQRVYLM